MAVAFPNPVAGRLAKALGLQRCRDAELRLSVDEVVMLRTNTYASGEQLDSLSAEIETGDYVVITRDEYDRLMSNQKEPNR